MEVKSIQPAFTGKLTPQQAKKLIQKMGQYLWALTP